MLVGPEPEDEALAKSFQRSARRLGMRIVERRKFILSNDPRKRELNNPLLLTGTADYDIVYIADAQGEFARLTPYKTHLPRPVVGSNGLTGAAWHWAWERHGAPQLENFSKKRLRDTWQVSTGLRGLQSSDRNGRTAHKKRGVRVATRLSVVERT